MAGSEQGDSERCVLDRSLTTEDCSASCEACLARGGWQGRKERAEVDDADTCTCTPDECRNDCDWCWSLPAIVECPKEIA
jgi:hypothetical protein